MSDTQTDAEDVVPPHADVERVARANGWRPKEEFKGPPDKWAPADVFVARGLENPAILADRNKMLADKQDKLERKLHETKQTLEAKLDGAVDTVSQLTNMLRTSEQRAYDRARRELKEQRDKAVEVGDTQTYKQLDKALEDLEEAGKPEPPKPVVKSEPTPPAAPPAKRALTQEDQTALNRFFTENAWYDHTKTRADSDSEMTDAADFIHARLVSERPDLSMEENLNIVRQRLRSMFPDKFTRAKTPPAEDTEFEEEGAPAVSSSSASRAPSARPRRRSFDAMPRDAKEAYVKYAKMLEGKGAPLTKDEYATTYWSQFPEE